MNPVRRLTRSMIARAGLGVVDVLVTDAEPQQLAEALRAADVEVVVAST